jgi:hypothetical protein
MMTQNTAKVTRDYQRTASLLPATLHCAPRRVSTPHYATQRILFSSQRFAPQRYAPLCFASRHNAPLRVATPLVATQR